MPVVMTGSPGGPLGGNGGSLFGSGLSGMVSSPSKVFTPNLETWARRAEEDRAIVTERKKEAEELRNARMTMVAAQQQAATERKKKGKSDFKARQEER